MIIVICDMPRQKFSLCELCIFTIRICNFSNFVALCTDDTDTTPICYDKRFIDLGVGCENILPSQVRSVTGAKKITVTDNGDFMSQV